MDEPFGIACKQKNRAVMHGFFEVYVTPIGLSQIS